MPSKDVEHRRETWRKWYHANPVNAAKSKANSRRQTQKIVTAVRTAKDVPCMDCGVRYPYYVMQFDHIGGNKEFQISQGKYSGLRRTLKEIEKCEVVCANCHMERTHGNGD